MRKSTFAALVAALIVSAGCTESGTEASYVKIVPEIRTRVTGMHFDKEDCIGLTIVKGGETFVENAMMRYDGAAFGATDLLWYNDLKEKSTLTAYYPYSQTGVPAEFTVAADQSAGCEGSDFLGAVKSDVTPGTAPVAMLFYHLMSQLTIVVTNNSDAAVSEIVIDGLVPTAEVDLAGLRAQAKAGVSPASIKACELQADARYRAILVPQQGSLTVKVTTADGKEHSKSVASALFESGKQYDVSVIVTNIDISVSLSGEIHDWEDGGSIDGGGNATGNLEFGGVSYRTVQIGGREWMAENLRLVPTGATFGSGIWNPAGGADAVATHGMLYDYPTATGQAATAAVAGQPVQGICPTGWHIPDADELAALLAAGAGSDFFSCAGYWIASVSGGRYGSVTKGYLISSSLAENERCSCLVYETGMQPEAGTVRTDYGVSVRCVRDAAQ